ncbi:tripartite tricarboxylate transporter permease [Candidatus Pacearchaeota archaeon]|nr:tripartite tricarboxylate transporter permease [Candidatus Pacearchaeota archaeon]
MFLEILLAILVGILAGTISGLTPGIHINLVGAMLLSISGALLGIFSPITLAVFIVSMSITHTFIDFIPSILLGAPDEDTILSVLPGHEMLKQGRGYEAIFLATYGSAMAIPIILFFTPITIFIAPALLNFLSPLIPYILIIASGIFIFQEKRKFTALAVFLLAGFLGIIVFNSSLTEPFLPMLSGLFGASSIIISLKTSPKIPKQIIEKPRIPMKKLIKPALACLISTPLCSSLPGIGSGQAAIIGASVTKQTNEEFIIMLGAINTIVMGLSFIVLYSISKTRTGSAAVVRNLISSISFTNLLIIIATICLVGTLCYFYTLFLAKKSILVFSKINYSVLSASVLVIISLIVFIFSGFYGFYVFIISTSAGIFGVLSGVRRIHLLGCIVLPTILIYLL